MPNIFPPIDAYQPPPVAYGGDPRLLPAVQAKSQADAAVQAATPKPYDYSAHGVLGNIGHVLGRVGNIAADVLDPRVTPLIPGTDEWKQNQLEHAQGQQQLATTNLENAQKESDTAANQQATLAAEAPVRSSTVDKNEAEATKALNPDENPERQTYDYLTKKLGMSPQEAFKELNTEKQKATVQRPDTPEQQSIDEYQRLHPGATVAQAEHAYAQNTHVQSPPQVLMMIPGPNGSSTAQVVRPGTTVAPGAQTAAGLNSENTGTSQQRNAAGRANLVLQSIPDVMKDLDDNAAQLGPGMGRFNDIYSGKIGAPNPQFSGLMADLHLMSTAVALAHAQGRMSNALLDEFNHMIASPNQSPENIKAVLGKVQNYMQRASQQGKPGSDNGAGAPPPGSKIVDFTQLGKK